MSEMVERVARAMWEAEGVAYGWNETDRKFSWDEAVKRGLFGVGPFRIFARAAIEAMRAPTEGMISAHHIVPDDNDFRERAIANWQCIIDEVLSEAP